MAHRIAPGIGDGNASLVASHEGKAYMASVIEALKKQEGFTAAEEEIASYILHHADDIAKMGIADLSAATHSSNATIVRFCRKLGLPGYRDLRIALAVELERRRGKLSHVDVNKPFTNAESTATLMRSAAELQKEAIDTCYASLSPCTIDELAHAAIRARTVFLYGSGDSNISGEMFSELVLKMGILCVNAGKTSDTLPRSYAARKGDLALFITYSGSILTQCTKDIEVLKERGCQLAIITAHSAQDPVMTSFDITVPIPPREAVYGKIATFYSQTCIRYILMCVYGRIYALNYDNSSQRKDAIDTQMLPFTL
jgi:RpiR family carbohydrate utilization transcriptional regulator